MLRKRQRLTLTLFLLIFASGLTIVALNTSAKPSVRPVIYLQPLGAVPQARLAFLQQAVTDFYGYRCVIRPAVALTPDVLAASQTRYEASKILKKFNSPENLLLITTRDIAHRKSDALPEYGIFGLGYRPGTTCVVSTFRLRRGVTEAQCLERLKKVALHEIGHNLGLPHCTHDRLCMMQAAKGTIKQVDEEKAWFCAHCRGKLAR